MDKSLYDRLGGAKGIAVLVDDIVEAHMNNPVIKARFVPYREQAEQLAAVKKHLRDFLGAGSGGQESYTGRSMNISDGEYMAAIDDIMKTLQKHNIDEQTQKDVLAISYSLKNEIVHM
jgi:hemoglobin